MMGRTPSNNVEPTPNEAVLKYKCTGKDEDGPSVALFRADFSKRFPEKSTWNICLAEVFVVKYTRNSLPFDQLKDVFNYFMTYLRSLKATHRNMAANSMSGSGMVHEEKSRRDRIWKCKKTVRMLSTSLYN
jgi:hypothetical protein